MRRLGVIVTGVLLLAASSAFADDTSKGEVSGGWRYYHATIKSTVSLTGVSAIDDFSKGWYADVSGNLSPKFAVVGEVGGTYTSDASTQTLGALTVDDKSETRLHSFMGGIRIRAPQNARFIPFGQVLFGGERNTSSFNRTTTVRVGNTTFPPSTTARQGEASDPALALDGGVTISVGWVGVRAQGGYVRMFKTTDADAFRFSLGGVFRF